MDLPELVNFCLSLPETEEATPFGPDVLVYKIHGKLFALTQPDEFPARVNLKCDPARAEELREQYPNHILPGYHMNKKHWNTLILDGALPSTLIKELIEHSYHLVAPKVRAQRKKST